MEKTAEFMTKRDVKGLYELLDHAFPGVMHFYSTWAHTCNSRPENYKQHLIIKDKGKVVSHVGVFPMIMKVYGGGILRVGGIGGVATYKEYRGQGLMSALLKKAVEIMKKEYDVSWLGGDRRRYGSFGWENAGRISHFNITNRSIRTVKAGEFRVKKYRGEKKYLKQIIKIHNKELFGIARRSSDYPELLCRAGKENLLALKGKKLKAYINISIPEKNKDGVKSTHAHVFEYGGDPEGIKYLIKYIIEKLGRKSVGAGSPVFNSGYKKLLTYIGSGWSIGHGGMIKILHLRSTLKNFEKQMNLKLKSAGNTVKTEITFKVPELNESVTLSIGKEVKFPDKAAAKKIILNEKDMTRLLFGLTRPSEEFNLKKDYAVLDLIFPLDYFFWPLETV